MKILILGSSGFLGSTIYKILNTKFKVIHTGLNKRKYDLSNKKKLDELIRKSNPTIIINCCAITDVDYCEKNKKKTKLVNSEILKWIINYKKKMNNPFCLIHFSTDGLYYLNKKNTEKDKIKIFNYYAKTKFLAENYCDSESLIFRTNFFGKSNLKKNSFSDFVYKSFKSKKKFFLLDDVFFNPLSATTIAKIIEKILKKKKRYQGIYNLGSNSFLSKYQFAVYFAKKAKIYNSNYFEIRKSKKLFKTKRPKFMTMSVKKFEKTFDYKLPHIKKEIIKEIKENYENI
jgi:dTDP-4-dehydrorhamnose reductase